MRHVRHGDVHPMPPNSSFCCVRTQLGLSRDDCDGCREPFPCPAVRATTAVQRANALALLFAGVGVAVGGAIVAVTYACLTLLGVADDPVTRLTASLAVALVTGTSVYFHARRRYLTLRRPS